MKRAIMVVVLMILSGVFSLVSCSKQEKQKEMGEMAGHGMAADWKFTLPAGDAAAGRKVFVEAECYKCHEVKGEKFPAVAEKEKGVGSELSQMAGMHPVEFFAESIINPNAVIDPKGKELGYLGEDGKSKMPDYSDVLTAKQVTDLAAYLASLKGSEHKTH
jgi:mono/diheme cytochrome c family protein